MRHVYFFPLFFLCPPLAPLHPIFVSRAWAIYPPAITRATAALITERYYNTYTLKCIWLVQI